MATIINNPYDSGTSADSSAGVVIGVVLALLIIILFFAFALPYLQNEVTPGAPETGGNPNLDSNVNIDLQDTTVTPLLNETPSRDGSNSY